MSKLTICFLGDISLTNSIYDSFLKNNNLISPEIIDHINSSDFIIGNYEFAIVKNKKSSNILSRDRFQSNPKYLEIIKDINWTFFTIANNHISDWGYENIIVTKNELKKISKFEPIGAGINKYEAIKPIILEKNNIRFGFVAISEKEINNATESSFGSAPFDKELVKETIVLLKKMVDHVVVLMHWGTEFIPVPSPEQKKIAKYLSNLNVSLIVGTHPHIIQGYEKIKNTHVYYSLGNFITDLNIDNKPRLDVFQAGHYSIILKANFNKNEIISFDSKIVEINSNKLNVNFLHNGKTEKIYQWINYISNNINDKSLYFSELIDVLGKRELKALIDENKNFKRLFFNIIYHLRPKYFKKIFFYLFYKSLSLFKSKNKKILE